MGQMNLTPDQIDEVYNIFTELNIRFGDEDKTGEVQLDSAEEPVVEIKISEEGEVSDPIRMYLREIGKIAAAGIQDHVGRRFDLDFHNRFQQARTRLAEGLDKRIAAGNTEGQGLEQDGMELLREPGEDPPPGAW